MNINDAILAATGGPTVPDGLLAYFRANGATSFDRTTAEHEFLDARTAPTGQLQDRWFEWLGSLGYTGTLDDRRYSFWVAGGTFP